MGRGDWLRSLSPQERQELARKGAEALKQTRQAKELDGPVELDEFIDLANLHLENDEDMDKLVNQIILYLAQTSRVSVKARPTIRLLLEAVDIRNAREQNKKFKEVEKWMQGMEKTLAEMKKLKERTSSN